MSPQRDALYHPLAIVEFRDRIEAVMQGADNLKWICAVMLFFLYPSIQRILFTGYPFRSECCL